MKSRCSVQQLLGQQQCRWEEGGALCTCQWWGHWGVRERAKPSAPQGARPDLLVGWRCILLRCPNYRGMSSELRSCPAVPTVTSTGPSLRQTPPTFALHTLGE